MKIALIRKKFQIHGGAERHAADFIAELLKAGHEVHLFASEWKETPGVHFHPVPMLKWGSFFKTLSFARNVKKEVSKFSFNIVQSNEKTVCQDIYRAGDGCHWEWLLKRSRYRPFWKNFLILLNPFHRLTLQIEQKIFSSDNYKKIIANSRMCKEEIMLHYGVPEEDIAVIYNGVDLELFHPSVNEEERNLKRKEWGIAPGDTLALFVGSGFERKGLKFLLLAMGELKKRDQLGNLKLMVCGKGKPSLFTGLLKKLKIEDRVVFTGVVADREHYFRAADLFAFPAIYEPFSNVVLEALATGLPVLTSGKNGAGEVLTEGKEGYVVKEPSDVQGIADKLLLLMDSKHRKEISPQARLLAEQFTLERNTSEVLKLYEEVITL